MSVLIVDFKHSTVIELVFYFRVNTVKQTAYRLSPHQREDAPVKQQQLGFLCICASILHIVLYLVELSITFI